MKGKKLNLEENRINLVSVNMGYGHQRTAYALKKIALGESVINANDYEAIPEKDRKVWESSRRFYESISSFKRVPVLGDIIFGIFDEFQKILDFYPKRDLSKPNLYLKNVYPLFKKGWGKDLIKRLKENPLPLVCTFFIPAFMAEFFNYSGEIYCVICDADISRSWGPLNPKKSRIKYFAPNTRVIERLKLYGIKEENIFFTGYPLPQENIGVNDKILTEDMKHRILNLDPKKKYLSIYKSLVDKYIGQLPRKSDHCLTLMFSVGGAGVQKELSIEILKGLREKIAQNSIKVILSAGIRKNVRDYLKENIKKLKFECFLGNGIEILFAEDIENYFKLFNEKLRKTDILWTKPSELSFYAGLGIPIILAPTIGSQEDFNKEWLLKVGVGRLQKNPIYAGQWLFDYLEEGWLAGVAMQGFMEAGHSGVENIRKIIFER